MHRKITLGLLLAVVSVLSFLSSFALAATAKDDLRFDDVRKQTAQFLEYEKKIELTPAQEAVYREALQGLPAPCCKDNTALTCCCPCNSARTWWGLTKHLVADLGYDVAQTRAKVDEWFRFINPSGWSGDTCYSSGGCAKPFHQNGCGGMNAGQLAF